MTDKKRSKTNVYIDEDGNKVVVYNEGTSRETKVKYIKTKNSESLLDSCDHHLTTNHKNKDGVIKCTKCDGCKWEFNRDCECDRCLRKRQILEFKLDDLRHHVSTHKDSYEHSKKMDFAYRPSWKPFAENKYWKTRQNAQIKRLQKMNQYYAEIFEIEKELGIKHDLQKQNELKESKSEYGVFKRLFK